MKPNEHGHKRTESLGPHFVLDPVKSQGFYLPIFLDPGVRYYQMDTGNFSCKVCSEVATSEIAVIFRRCWTGESRDGSIILDRAWGF